MITISINHIRTFLRAAAKIRTNKLLPITNFIRFHNGTITKSNLHEFVLYSCEFEGTFLIEEHILASFISGSKSEEVSFSWTAKKVTISDHVSKASSQNEDVRNFPAIQAPETGAVLLPESFALHVGRAAQIAYGGDEDVHPRARHVFVGGNDIASCDNWIACLQEIPETLPQMILAKGPALIISRMGATTFAESKSYHFFYNESLTFGFIKPECLWADLSILKRKGELPSFTLHRSELMSFCEMCMSASPLFGGVATMTRTALRMHDVNYDIEIDRQVGGLGQDIEPFGFSPKTLLRLLHIMPDDDIIVWRAAKSVYLSCGDYQVAIQGLVI